MVLGEDGYQSKRREFIENNLYKPNLNTSTKEKLLNTYLEDIEKLEKLIDKDLSDWKSIE